MTWNENVRMEATIKATMKVTMKLLEILSGVTCVVTGVVVGSQAGLDSFIYHYHETIVFLLIRNAWIDFIFLSHLLASRSCTRTCIAWYSDGIYLVALVKQCIEIIFGDGCMLFNGWELILYHLFEYWLSLCLLCARIIPKKKSDILWNYSCISMHIYKWMFCIICLLILMTE